LGCGGVGSFGSGRVQPGRNPNRPAPSDPKPIDGTAHSPNPPPFNPAPCYPPRPPTPKAGRHRQSTHNCTPAQPPPTPQKLDIIANDIFTSAVACCGRTSITVSEEEEDPVAVDVVEGGRWGGLVFWGGGGLSGARVRRGQRGEVRGRGLGGGRVLVSAGGGDAEGCGASSIGACCSSLGHLSITNRQREKRACAPSTPDAPPPPP
jgi:hypothetical protein